MGDGVLTGEGLRRCLDAGLSYPEVGATRDRLPPGYHHVRERARLGRGQATFEAAVAGLLGWDLHRRSGLRVIPSVPIAAEGAVAVLHLGWGPLAVRAPVRVVYEVDEPDRRGFAYGTLPGHPESGEELFVVEREVTGAVLLSITAFSRPATRLARCGGPVGRLVQRRVTDRYLRALRT